MKERLMTVLASLFLLLPAFVSCNDKKDEPEDPNGGNVTIDVSKIVGTYSGSLGWKVMTSEGAFDGEYSVRISNAKESDDKVTVELPECSFTVPGTTMHQTIPSLTVENIGVSEDGNVYTLSDTDFEIKDGENTYIGTKLSGTIAGHDVRISYTLTPGTMPMPINFTFTGTQK